MTPPSLLPPFGTPAGEIARALLVALVLTALLAIAELWRRRRAPPAEWTRKFVHTGGGVVAAFLPWLFASHWTVLLLAAFLTLLFVTPRRRRLFPSVSAVERTTRGEIWFPVGVYLLFAIARHQPVFYLVALSGLGLSDTAAALLGRVYGRTTYTVEGGRKSLEGSAAFFLVTFLAVHLMLLLFTSTERWASVTVAVQVALLTASFEAISLRGSDNLIVPLGTYYLLLKMARRTAPEIGVQLLAQVLLLVLMIVIARRTRLLTLGGAIAAHLVLYAAFSLGGWWWCAAPAGALAAFVGLDRRYGGAHGLPAGGHEVAVIYYVAIVAVVVLFADNSFATLLPLHPRLSGGHPFYPLFAGALAGTLAALAFEMRESSPAVRRHHPARRVATAFVLAWLAVLLPGFAVLGAALTFETAGVATLACAAGLALYVASRGRVKLGDPARSHLRLQALCVLLAIALVLPLHFAWAEIAPWRPAP